MYPTSHHSSQNQKLSISGYQHKLQILIDQKEIKEYYSNFILKTASRELSKVAINEHLNTTFLKEFGFEIPFNAIIFDERFGEYSYIIKRFDIDKNSKKIPQISLNALMKSNDQYEGNIEEISNAMVYMAQNPGLRRHMGEAGYQRLIRKYKIEDMKKTYETIYREASERQNVAWDNN